MTAMIRSPSRFASESRFSTTTPQLPQAPTALVAALACFSLRYLAIRRGWNLPIANWREPGT
jgi:uncharacterized membrane protein YeiH